MSDVSEEAADAFTRLALEPSGDEPLSPLRLPNEVILDIIELIQETYVAQEEQTEPHSLKNLRL
jgi:hypothetical protein